MSTPGASPHGTDPDPDAGTNGAFNPFVLLDVHHLDRATLSRYATFLVGLRRTLRGAVRAGGAQEAMLQAFLDEVEEALAGALAARRNGRR
ncbi:MAG TPA: hypothetical protein VK002_15320 [Rubricoccaceae bacterium]|nr:hypothetical protein [Rubricoccaceae bacterium]